MKKRLLNEGWHPDQITFKKDKLIESKEVLKLKINPIK
jgi:hypothetical protein